MTPQQLIALVAGSFGLQLAELLGRSRVRHIAEARQAAAWVLKRAYPRLGQIEIGRLLGGRDHTTIGYAIRRVDARIAEQPALRAQLLGLLPQQAPAAQPAQPAEALDLEIHAMRWWIAQSRMAWHVRVA